MTGKIQVILFGAFLAILFIIIRKLSKKKVKKILSKKRNF